MADQLTNALTIVNIPYSYYAIGRSTCQSVVCERLQRIDGVRMTVQCSNATSGVNIPYFD